jgi:chromatin remodeling complex protein RSC6
MARKMVTQKVYPDTALASIIGSKPTPYSGIIKALWTYFKKHKLNSGRTIKLDARLRASRIWGNAASIDMTEVSKALKHASA